ncbi:hypothetical protein SAMN02745136_04667 [Anaerocolumna jejuensis DSM 15929]|uniref:CDI immunity protein domain-containing protein n=1 Tax=Anaerocolumna jejuensis DSM 15929 TaxID=1121322 RepID=A0A1M6ZUC5_9FIRM|nr:ribonuclease toxin immunity protein CdiI [Anaerocolumna jejuensis]SHL34006.1 hypothetical protein SAMN02745136_04667 [Anaerocolumna jejuensis DSM 15929]
MLTENLEKENLEKIFGVYNDNIDVMILSLNYCLGDSTLKTLNNMLNGQGVGGNSIGYFFPQNFDLWDEDYFEKGVMFQWGIRGIIVDNQTFYKYLKRGVSEFIKLYPKEQTDAFKLLQEIKVKYNCLDDDNKNVILKELVFND